MMLWRSGSYSRSFTPSTTVRSGSVAGAEMTTFFAPASRCFWAEARSVKSPVDSIATSTPSSPQGSSAGSRTLTNLISWSPARMKPSPASTGRSSVPSTESCFSRCAIVFVSPMSFAATSSKSPPRARWARKKFRPIRPNPLIPTLIMSAMRLEKCQRRARPCGRGPRRPSISAVPVPIPERGKRSGRERDKRRADREAPRTTLPVLAPHPRPWRRTGSESVAGRARTRRCRV